MSNFRKMAPQWLQNSCSKKNFKLLKCEHIIIVLKHVVWRFRIYNYFREIFKYANIWAKTDFAKFLKMFHKISKFGYFAESNYIFQISRPRALKWYIICSHFKSLPFWSHCGAISWELLIKSRNQNIFQYLKWILFAVKFLFQWYIVWFTVQKLSLGGGGGGGALRATSAFSSLKLCIRK